MISPADLIGYCAIQILFDILSKNLITFAVRKSEDSRNPVNYLV